MAAPLITDPPRPPTSYRQARKNQRAAQARIQERITNIDQQILECEDPERTLKLFGTKQLLENMYGWDGDFGGSDVWYELRGQGTDDPTRWVPLSVPSDRRHGTNWPIWRWDQDLDRLRNFSRMLCTQNAYARGLLRNLTNFVIGKGFAYKVQPRKDLPTEKQPGEETLEAYRRTVQHIVDDFLARNRWNGPCDPREGWDEEEGERSTTPTGTREREGYRRVHRDGEALIRLFFVDDGKTDVRFAEPEQLRNPGQNDPDGDGGDFSHGWTFGIKHQMQPFEDTETLLWYHLAYQDSTTAGAKDNGEFVPAREMVHIKHPDTDGAVKRGIPSFSWEAAQAFTRASKLQKNMSIAASVRAATAEIWKHTYGTQSQISQLAAGFQASTVTDEATGLQKTLERVWPGMIRRVPYGQEPVQVPENNATAQHQIAAQGDLRQGSAAFCAPEYLTGDASNANYSSTQEAGAPFVNNSESEQEHFKAAYLTVVWKAVGWAVKSGKCPREAMDVLEIQVEAPQVKRTDELQKAQKDQILVGLKAKSPQTVSMENGLDPETEAANIEENEERFGMAGDPLALPDEDGNLPGKPPGKGGKGPATPQVTESAAWDEKKHPRDKGKFSSSGAGGGDARSTQGTNPDPHEYVSHADSEVPKTLEKAAGLKGKFKAAFGAIKNKAVAMYKKLEAKHGKAGAIAILAAGHALGLATPLALVPGSTFLATAAVAYAYDAAKKGLKAAGAIESLESEGPDAGDDVEDLAYRLLAELVTEAKAAMEEADAA
jgi:hypothetical protein